MAYAMVADLRMIWPGLPVDQESRAAALLEDAAVRIDAYAPMPDPVTPAALAVRLTVSREMVMYVMANDGAPGVTQESRTMGPFSQSFTFDRPGRTLMLTDEQKAMLRPRHQVAFSAPMGAPAAPPWWVTP